MVDSERCLRYISMNFCKRISSLAVCWNYPVRMAEICAIREAYCGDYSIIMRKVPLPYSLLPSPLSAFLYLLKLSLCTIFSLWSLMAAMWLLMALRKSPTRAGQSGCQLIDPSSEIVEAQVTQGSLSSPCSSLILSRSCWRHLMTIYILAYCSMLSANLINLYTRLYCFLKMASWE